MQAISLPTLAISLAALVISVYGIGERRHAAHAAERLRFATIVDELNGLHLQHVQVARLTEGDLTDVINGRRELLATQGLSMIKKLRKHITSPEYRTLAHALSRAGYPAEADEIWRTAIATAAREGHVQSLFAHRGYAYLLFTEGRLEDARTELRRAVDVIGSADDTAIIHQIKTLKFWADTEREEDPDRPEAAELLVEAQQAVTGLKTEQAQRRMLDFLASSSPTP